MEKAIIVDHLSYEDKLKDISFTIQKGEFVGILLTSLDPGKDCVLKVISGLLKPTSGFVSVLGHDPFLKANKYLKQISFLSESNDYLTKNLPPIDILEITRIIYGLSDREFNKNLSELTQYIKDPKLLDMLIYKPQILLLNKLNWDLELIYKYNNKNESTTLFVTSKIDNLINLARRVIIIDKGNILFDGAIDEIVTKFAKEKVIKTKLSLPIDIKIANEIGAVKRYDYPYLYITAPRSIVSFTAAEMMQNFPVINLEIEELSIEEIIENMKL